MSRINLRAHHYALREARRSDLDLLARALLMTLALHVDQAGVCYPGTGTLAETLGVHPNSIRRARAQLVDAGLIAVQHRGRRSTIVRFPVVAAGLRVVDDPGAEAVG